MIVNDDNNDHHCQGDIIMVKIKMITKTIPRTPPTRPALLLKKIVEMIIVVNDS